MKVLLNVIIGVLFCASCVFAQDVPTEVTRIYEGLMKATAEVDYEAFQKYTDPEFHPKLDQEAFTKIAQALTPVLKEGYESKFLTKIRQKGFDVFVWEMTPNTGEDQYLVKVVMKDGKASGFWMH